MEDGPGWTQQMLHWSWGGGGGLNKRVIGSATHGVLGGPEVLTTLPKGQSFVGGTKPALSEGHPGTTVHSHSGPHNMLGSSDPPPSTFWGKMLPLLPRPNASAT